MTNFEKIILSAVGVLLVAVVVIGAVVMRQQKTISALSGGATGNLKQSTAQNATPPKGSSLAETFKQFSGTVESISGNQLVISTKLIDFSKPKNPEKLKNTGSPMNISSSDFEVLEKKITVNTNEKTIFENKNLSELKSGDTVSIDSDKSPYMTNAVTAAKVTSAVPK